MLEFDNETFNDLDVNTSWAAYGMGLGFKSTRHANISFKPYLHDTLFIGSAVNIDFVGEVQ